MYPDVTHNADNRSDVGSGYDFLKSLVSETWTECQLKVTDEMWMPGMCTRPCRPRPRRVVLGSRQDGDRDVAAAPETLAKTYGEDQLALHTMDKLILVKW